MTNTHKIIAVYGNSGSYKTSTSLSIAKAISSLQNTADIAVVGVSSTTPLYALLFPNSKINVSLGKLLASEDMDQEAIISQIQMQSKIGVLAYNAGENMYSHALPIDSRIDDFYMQLRHLVNYTIVDCTSDVVAHKLTAKAIINADITIELITADIFGMAFHRSGESILLGEQYHYNDFWRYLTISDKFNHDIPTMESLITKVRGVIPYSSKTVANWNEGRAFDDHGDSKYSKVIMSIANDIIKDGEE